MTAVLNTTKLLEIFIACDDFVKKLSQYQLESNYQTDKIFGESIRWINPRISSSEFPTATTTSSQSGKIDIVNHIDI